MSEILKIGELNIDLIRKNIKNMHLAVYPPTGRVRLAVPSRAEEETIRLFVVSKIAWIRRHQRSFQQQNRQSPLEYKARESHYFQGRRYLLSIEEADAPARVELRNNNYIQLFTRPNSSKEQRASTMREWYRAELKAILPEIIERWATKIGVKVEEWHIKQMKTRWGTCNIPKKRIWLNLELAKKPLQCLEYVVVHELTHLLERYHNARFYALMDTFLPNWRALKSELNQAPLAHEDWAEEAG